jgi:hypothetical protein
MGAGTAFGKARGLTDRCAAVVPLRTTVDRRVAVWLPDVVLVMLIGRCLSKIPPP